MNSMSPNVIVYAFIVSLGGFVFGFDASVISGTVGFITTEFSLDAWQQGMVVSAPSLGALVAMFFAGRFSDKFGRKTVLQWVAILYLISAITSALAVNFYMLAVARLLGGLAFCSLMVAPLYIAEISQATHRGKLVSINQFNIVIGLSASYFTNYWLLNLSQTPESWLLSLSAPQDVWRWMLGLEIIPALLWCILLFTIVETPRWLVTQHREKDAKRALQALGEKDASAMLTSIKASLGEKTLSLKAQLSLIISPKLRLPLLIGLVIGIVQQLTGINVIFFYAPTIFEQSGIGTDAAFVQAIGVGLTNVIFTIVAILAIDRFGRKPLLVIGLSGIIFSMRLCAYGFKQATYTLDAQNVAQIVAQTELEPAAFAPLVDKTFTHDVDFKQALQAALGEQTALNNEGVILQQATQLNPTLILVGIIMFVACFAMSLGPVMWVLFSEIFPNSVRGVAISVVTVFNSLCSFLVQFIFPWELANYGAAFTFMSYAVVALIGLVFVLKYLPETKGLDLEALSERLAK